MQGRVSTPKAAASWGVSRRMLRSNPVVDAAPRVRNGRRSVRPEPEQVVALLRAATEESRPARLGHSPGTLLRIYAQEIEQGEAGVAASLAARLDG